MDTAHKSTHHPAGVSQAPARAGRGELLLQGRDAAASGYLR
jgi:hypothetical protein